MDLEETTDESERTRQIILLSNGRHTLKRDGRKLRMGIVHMTYLSRAFEWAHLKLAIIQRLRHVNLLEKIEMIELITFG